MSMHSAFFYNAAALIIIGTFGILTRRNIIKILLSINILQTGVNLLLVAIGWRPDAAAPIVTALTGSAAKFVDPLPQAMVLTSIVINLSITALALTIITRVYKLFGTVDTKKLKVLKG